MISKAGFEDIPQLVELLNISYRGNSSRQGWTTEADLVEGDLRTDEEDLNRLMKNPDTTFLKYTTENEKIEGCVFLQKRQGKMYFGMLSVNPSLQAKGIGKQIMAAAEDLARKEACPIMYMRVITGRDELINWYERLGYKATGELQPFENTRFGKAKVPIEFIVMQKEL